MGKIRDKKKSGSKGPPPPSSVTLELFASGEPVPQARVRYHADGVTAMVEIDEAARRDLAATIERARELRRTTDRPPVADNENLCPRCSLAPVCLPEEERLARKSSPPASPPKLFPSRREAQTLHVVTHGTPLGRSGAALLMTSTEGPRKIPIEQLDGVIIHGFAQVSTQAIHLCARHGVPVQWLTGGGKYAAGTASLGRVQQRIRQNGALCDSPTRLRLAQRLVEAKIETQRRYVLRLSRGEPARRAWCRPHLDQMRQVLRQVPRAPASSSLLGLEGTAARAYFACLRVLASDSLPAELRPGQRTRRPPRDRFSCLLSFGYALVQTLVHRSILAVGLEPALGFYHQPRTAAPPLVLDLMELFRTLLWDIPLLGSLHRGQWNPTDDFSITAEHVWLSDAGRRKVIELFENRLTDSHRHPYTGQSLQYARIVELEARLLEKEWTGCPGLFAQLRLR